MLAEIRSKFKFKSTCRKLYNPDIIELLDPFHCIRRFGRACSSEAHPSYPQFMRMLHCAFFIKDQTDYEKLVVVWKKLGKEGTPPRNVLRNDIVEGQSPLQGSCMIEWKLS